MLGDPGSREKAGRKFSSMGERAPGLDIAYMGSRKSFLERKNHYTSHEINFVNVILETIKEVSY